MTKQQARDLRVKSCEKYCSHFFQVLHVLCAKIPCQYQIPSQAALFTASNLCIECCQGDGFYMNCIKPLCRMIAEVKDQMTPDEYDDYINTQKNAAADEETKHWWNEYNRQLKSYWKDVYDNDKRVDPRYR